MISNACVVAHATHHSSLITDYSWFTSTSEPFFHRRRRRQMV